MTLASQGARLVGRYLLCDQIGSGGMATIHLARLLGPEGFSRTVAVKQLHPQFARDPEFVTMFLDEARLAVRIRHANVVSPLDIVTTGSDLFIVMDYVNGESLATLLRAATGPLAPNIASAIAVQVLLGLHAAHEATREQGESLGIVHRDVSPQNILVGQDGAARVLDFGIAKAAARSQTTEDGKLKGKIGYIAPEQLRMEPVDRRADIFTSGIVLWECLTGSSLFAADAIAASMEMILHGKVAPPSTLNPAVSPELDQIVLKSLAQDPAERFQDALSMARALQTAVPPASVIEVMHWVEGLVGPELLRKQELVKRAESVTAEDVELLKTRPASAEITLLSPTEPARTSGAPQVTPAEITLTAVGELRPGTAPSSPPGMTERIVTPAHPASLPPAETSTAVSIRAERDAATRGRFGKRKVVALILAAALAVSFVATAVLSSESPESATLEPAREASKVQAAAPASTVQVVAAPVSTLPRPEVTPLLEPSARPAASARPTSKAPAISPKPVAPGASAAVAPVTRPSALTTKPTPTRTAASDSSKSAARDKAKNCNPPWTINAQNVKVFKEECLR